MKSFRVEFFHLSSATVKTIISGDWLVPAFVSKYQSVLDHFLKCFNFLTFDKFQGNSYNHLIGFWWEKNVNAALFGAIRTFTS